MSTIFTYIGLFFAGILFVFVAGCIVFTFQYVRWFHWRSCKHCGHNMEFKGLKEDSGNGHYLFHCPHCGAWEQVPKEEFVRNLDTSPLNE